MGATQFLLGPSCSEGMVLQHGTRAVLWGWAEAGSRHVFSVAGRSAEAVTDSEGRWTAVWSGLPPGGPYQLNRNGEVLLHEVWVGDVWLCSGQSNMERSLEASARWPADALSFRGDPGIRQLCLPYQFDFRDPQTAIPGARWIGADSDEVVKFSAVAYHFARDLRQRSGIPQGLVLAAVGGSTVQAWLPIETLKDFPAQAAEAQRFGTPGWLDTVQKDEMERRDQWFAALESQDPKDPSRAGRGPWRTVSLPSLDHGGGPGSCWYRKLVELPPGAPGAGRIFLGTLVDSDDVWVNQTWVGSTPYQYPSRRHLVPAGTLQEGVNEVLIRVVSPEKRLGATPGKPWTLETEAGVVDLSGEWQARLGAPAPELPPATFLPLISLGLYNGLLAPLAPLSFRAVLWYQGESNIAASQEYEPLMTAMLQQWRRLFQRPDLPFLLVQLPLFGEAEGFQGDDGWAWVRDAQRRLAQGPHAGLVIALDAGEANDIHPADKETVGRRLALAARRVVLREPLEVWTGPLFQAAEREGRRLRLRFSQTGTGLQTRDGRPPAGFYLAGSDGLFHRAEAQLAGDDVVVEAAGVEEPVEVRYAWASNPREANLVNSLGLSAAPFRG